MRKRLLILLMVGTVWGGHSLGKAGEIDPSLIGWWEFEDGAGTVVTDSSGNGNDMAIFGDPTWDTSSRHRGVLVLDGQGDFAYSEVSFELPTYSIAVWFRVDGGTAERDIFGTYIAGIGYGVLLELRPNGELRYLHRFPFGGGGGTDIFTSSFTATTYDDGSWHHVVMAKSAEEITLYVDGQAVGSAADDTAFDQPLAHLVFGSLDHERNLRFFPGALDDIRIYDRVLAAEEIPAIMQGRPYPQAYEPVPQDNSMLGATATVLKWTPGDFAASHNVYFGESFDAVNEATPDDGAFAGNQTATTFLAANLAPGQTYYWRVDEINETEPESPWKGEVWSFWVQPAVAWNSSPADGTPYVRSGQGLSWDAGMGALFHTVYIGEDFNGVKDATEGGMMLAETTYDPGALNTDTTYYWRVDEFNGTTTNKGDIWSFTTVPTVAVTDPTLVGWWTLDEGEGTTAVDWSGHGHHGAIVGPPQWEPDGMDRGALVLNGVNNYIVAEGMMDSGVVLAEYTMALWFRADRQGGARDLIAAYSGGPTFGVLIELTAGGTMRFLHRSTTGGTGADLQTAETYDDGKWHHLALVKTADELIGYMDGEVAISAPTVDTFDGSFYVVLGVLDHLRANGRFFPGPLDDARIYDRALTAEEVGQIMRGDPTLAGNPGPDRDALVDIRNATALSWSAGDGAVSHNVYLGTDRDATAAAGPDSAEYQGNQAGTSLSLAGLVEFGGGDYHWRIDEVQADGAVVTGNVWKFTVPAYLVVDDFESYDNEVGSRVFETYIDGIGFTLPDPGNPGNGTGAAVGHDIWTGGYTNLMETADVYGGVQAMPIYYDNTIAPGRSEADRTFTPAENWTVEDVTTLVVHFRGAAENTGQLYVNINGTKAPYDGDAADIASTEWIAWEIDLASVGVNVANVTRMTIGIEGGESGVLYIDEIWLTKPEPEV